MFSGWPHSHSQQLKHPGRRAGRLYGVQAVSRHARTVPGKSSASLISGSLRRAAMALPLPSVDWEAESYPAYGDFVAIAFFAVFFFVIRFLLDRFVFEVVSFLLAFWLARKLIFNKGA
ncbi:hypothetical protein EJB05_19845 [Eragrostis curvula]|uniref:Uncharacterized protein n=1 Tax=Eragrostis curvula TaxID=38414 RepID=A0A5J9UZ43_9POAL|nr:hypothetical protein EJB05_19845 [Eragrostis curvula]